jgi:hypothetical protein
LNPGDGDQGNAPGAPPAVVDDPLLRAVGQLAREDAGEQARAESSPLVLDLLPEVLKLSRQKEAQLVALIRTTRQDTAALHERVPTRDEARQQVHFGPSNRGDAHPEGPRLASVSVSAPAHAPASFAGRHDPRVRRQRQRPWALAVGGLAVAAALVVGLVVPSEDRTPLPVYGVSAAGGIKEYRGAHDDPDEESVVATVQRVGADTELKIVCRPQSAASGQVTARAFLVRDGQSEEIRPKLRIAQTGAIELTVRGSDLGARGGTGSGKLRIAVSRPEHVSEIDPKAAVDATLGANLRWLTVPVELDHQ